MHRMTSSLLLWHSKNEIPAPTIFAAVAAHLYGLGRCWGEVVVGPHREILRPDDEMILGIIQATAGSPIGDLNLSIIT